MARHKNAAALADLRARIRAMELAPGTAIGAADKVVSFGIDAVDHALPWGGLPRGCLHEIESGDTDLAAGTAMAGAATAFATALLARFARDRAPVLWCLRQFDLYAFGLRRFGLDLDRLIVVRAQRPGQVLWVLEESLRSGQLGVVLGEVTGVDLVASRRLQLAAQSGNTTCLLLYRGQPRNAGASAAVTRWRIAPLVGGPAQGFDALGAPRWQLELTRCRGGAGFHQWSIEWSDETRCFTVAAPLADRSQASADTGLREAV